MAAQIRASIEARVKGVTRVTALEGPHGERGNAITDTIRKSFMITLRVLSIYRRMGVNALAQFRQVFGPAECIRKLCQSYIWRSMGGFQMKKHARY